MGVLHDRGRKRIKESLLTLEVVTLLLKAGFLQASFYFFSYFFDL